MTASDLATLRAGPAWPRSGPLSTLQVHPPADVALAALARPTTGPADVTIRGCVDELVLYAAGRAGAEVTVEGDPDAVAQVRATDRAV